VDTAGLREAGDAVEQAGVDRARRALAEADLVVLLLDRSAPLQPDDRDLLASLPAERTVVVLNKCDLPPSPGGTGVSPVFPASAVEISALTHAGLDRLREAIAERIGVTGQRGTGEVLVTSLRHQQALQGALEALERAHSGAERGATEEYLAEDLRAALASLGEITGATSREEIINEIFEKFCVGK
jgi:tRNA modification GTPase